MIEVTLAGSPGVPPVLPAQQPFALPTIRGEALVFGPAGQYMGVHASVVDAEGRVRNIYIGAEDLRRPVNLERTLASFGVVVPPTGSVRAIAAQIHAEAADQREVQLPNDGVHWFGGIGGERAVLGRSGAVYQEGDDPVTAAKAVDHSVTVPAAPGAEAMALATFKEICRAGGWLPLLAAGALSATVCSLFGLRHPRLYFVVPARDQLYHGIGFVRAIGTGDKSQGVLHSVADMQRRARVEVEQGLPAVAALNLVDPGQLFSAMSELNAPLVVAAHAERASRTVASAPETEFSGLRIRVSATRGLWREPLLAPGGKSVQELISELMMHGAGAVLHVFERRLLKPKNLERARALVPQLQMAWTKDLKAQCNGALDHVTLVAMEQLVSLAVAAALAAKLRLLDVSLQDVRCMLRAAFKRWREDWMLRNRDPRATILSQVQRYLLSDARRFSPQSGAGDGEATRRTITRAGGSSSALLLVGVAEFENELSAGFDYRDVRDVLRDSGYLHASGGKGFKYWTRLPRTATGEASEVRFPFYAIKKSLLDDPADGVGLE